MTEHVDVPSSSTDSVVSITSYVPKEPVVQKLRQLVEQQKEEKLERERLANQPRQPYRREEPRVGRNDPCPCGSGKKYKKCHMGKDLESH